MDGRHTQETLEKFGVHRPHTDHPASWAVRPQITVATHHGQIEERADISRQGRLKGPRHDSAHRPGTARNLR